MLSWEWLSVLDLDDGSLDDPSPDNVLGVDVANLNELTVTPILKRFPNGRYAKRSQPGDQAHRLLLFDQNRSFFRCRLDVGARQELTGKNYAAGPLRWSQVGGRHIVRQTVERLAIQIDVRRIERF